MTQWEQIKKEYREIPVPEKGQYQVLKAIADAKNKRNRFKRLTQYGTVAAALLLILLLPGMFLASGGLGASSENSSMQADCAVESESTGNAGNWFDKGAMKDGAMAPATYAVATPAPEQGYEEIFDEDDSESAEVPNYGLDDNKAETTVGSEDDLKKTETRSFTAEEQEAISREILKQMDKRMQETGEAYYKKSGGNPDGFELISKEQECYVNADGLLVIVFRAGVVAPEEQGTVEFIIPAEVASP